MHFDKRAMRSLFLLIAGCIVFGWLVLDTARAKTVFDTIWNLISPFIAGAGIAFIFNVPMRIIEHQLDGIHRLGIRRAFAIIMTILALILVIMFVIELLVPQIQLPVGKDSCLY